MTDFSNLTAQIVQQCTGPIIAGNQQCTICDLILLLDRLKNMAVGLLGILVALAVAYGGFTMMFSGGDPAKYQAGKDAVKYALIGALIVLSAYIIVSEIFRILQPAGENRSFVPWSRIQCGGKQ